jgi:hypothetical protein
VRGGPPREFITAANFFAAICTLVCLRETCFPQVKHPLLATAHLFQSDARSPVADIARFQKYDPRFLESLLKRAERT